MPEEAKFTKCQAETSKGEPCNNPAIYPKDDPIACFLESHQKQLDVYDEVPDEVKEQEKAEKEEEEKEEPKNPFDKTKKHVFATDRLSHTVFVRYPKDDDREYFRATFEAGKWETDDDEKAELLLKKMKEIPAMDKALEKIQ